VTSTEPFSAGIFGWNIRALPDLEHDIDRFNEKICQAGGKVLVEKVDVPGSGQLCCSRIPKGEYWASGSS
jgi:hypothetical protein